MRPFLFVSLCAYAAVLMLSALRGRRIYTVFVGIILGLHTLGSTLIEPALVRYGTWVQAGLWWGQVATYLYFARLMRHYSQSRPYRYLVAWPASYFAASAFMALPWGVATLFADVWAPWLPFAACGLGLLQSISTRREVRRILLDGTDAGPLHRHDRTMRKALTSIAPDAEPLRIIQITDPHLGSFMSERRLARICGRAVEQAPDLVLLTGDFLTIETQVSPDPLARALSPLAALRGRVFACFGNHDHECPELVRTALERNGIELLVGRAAVVALNARRVQIVGADHVWRDRSAYLAALARAHPREPGVVRLWLLHDPGAFRHVPDGEADLVFSGHTHGGHVGLVSLGLSHTFVGAVANMPDHGLWALGKNRLYVHRGTGHYGFPLRLGVPAEESVLELFMVDAPGPLHDPCTSDHNRAIVSDA